MRTYLFKGTPVCQDGSEEVSGGIFCDGDDVFIVTNERKFIQVDPKSIKEESGFLIYGVPVWEGDRVMREKNEGVIKRSDAGWIIVWDDEWLRNDLSWWVNVPGVMVRAEKQE